MVPQGYPRQSLVSTHTTTRAEAYETNPAFSTVSDVDPTVSESKIVELYAMGAKLDEKRENTAKPFIHQIRLYGPQGEIIRTWATFDEGALMEVMSTATFEKQNIGWAHYNHCHCGYEWPTGPSLSREDGKEISK